jgi:ribosomal protein S1
MIAVGDIVLCTITEIGPWGAYGVSESKLKVLVSFSELSWHRIEKTDDVISIGRK